MKIYIDSGNKEGGTGLSGGVTKIKPACLMFFFMCTAFCFCLCFSFHFFFFGMGMIPECLLGKDNYSLSHEVKMQKDMKDEDEEE